MTSLLHHIRHLPRKVRLLTHSLGQLIKDRANRQSNLSLLELTYGTTPNSWNEYRQTFTRTIRAHIVARIPSMATPATISVIVPTYNTPEPMLKAMLRSVQDQLYPHWELCIAGRYSWGQ